ncbi:hypothetical protein GWK47_016691 [Chionoecetes opilio]|uniref:Uncharacterized protein n=1 Tax=Chionoecetes opilio TaxID=41210 RepID=A0A8J4XUC5_CHIOP|nr:hypothetical protein GWK47_016691 [Chionoecetes opilio]
MEEKIVGKFVVTPSKFVDILWVKGIVFVGGSCHESGIGNTAVDICDIIDIECLWHRQGGGEEGCATCAPPQERKAVLRVHHPRRGRLCYVCTTPGEAGCAMCAPPQERKAVLRVHHPRRGRLCYVCTTPGEEGCATCAPPQERQAVLRVHHPRRGRLCYVCTTQERQGCATCAPPQERKAVLRVHHPRRGRLCYVCTTPGEEGCATCAPPQERKAVLRVHHPRRGRLCYVCTTPGASHRVRTLTHHSFTFSATRLFNCIPTKLRNMRVVSPDTFKYKLDAWLANIPDQPPTPGYTSSYSNSLLHWIKQDRELSGYSGDPSQLRR